MLWEGEPMSDHPGERPLSILFQDHNLFPHLCVADNIAVGINPNMRLSEEQILLAKNALCLLYTSPSPRDVEESRMPSSA